MTQHNPFHSSISHGTRRVSRWGDRIFFVLTGLGAVGVLVLLAALVLVLYGGARSSIQIFGFAFLYTKAWNPVTNVFGVVPFAIGTLLTSALALLISIPLSVGAAIFLTQQAPSWLRAPVGQVIELLAAIPSIIYGFWGLIVLVPIMRYIVEPQLATYLGWTGWFGGNPIGLDVLTASVVLSIMTVPTITAISRDSMATVPLSQKEAALAPRRHALGGDPKGRPAVCAQRHRSGSGPRPRPCPRRDDGRHARDREQQSHPALPLLAGSDDRQPHRE